MNKKALVLLIVLLVLPVVAFGQGGYKQFTLASGTYTANGQSSTTDTLAVPGAKKVGTLFESYCSKLTVYAIVDAYSGAGATLDLTVEDSPTNATGTWAQVVKLLRFTRLTQDSESGTGTHLNPTSPQVARADNMARYLRVNYTLGGTTPSFTVRVYGDCRVDSAR